MKRLELPKIGDLPKMILFHRDHPADPRVVLQIPNEDRTDAETYVLSMERPSDVVWLNALPRARELKDKLMVAQHIAMDTTTGYIQEIEDLDALTTVEEIIREARLKGAPRAATQDRIAATKRRARQHVPPVSPFRRYLGSRLW